MKTEESQGLSIELKDSSIVGGCDLCLRYRRAGAGPFSHYIYQISMKNRWLFNLCPNCKDDLLAKLKKLDP